MQASFGYFGTNSGHRCRSVSGDKWLIHLPYLLIQYRGYNLRDNKRWVKLRTVSNLSNTVDFHDYRGLSRKTTRSDPDPLISLSAI
jgi:hypothetical protein